MSGAQLSRRRFLEVSLSSAGALVVGVALPGCGSRAPHDADGGAAPAPFVADAWIRVEPDGRVVFVLDRVEMGQGTWTSHATLVAEELGVTPQEIRVEMACADRAYDHPEFGMQLTGGSSSLSSSWEPLRRAAAVTRERLLRAAAQELMLPRSELRVADGAVVSDGPAGEVRIGFGELVRGAAEIDVDPDDVELRTRDEMRWIGRSVPRLDAPAKVDGSAVFGIDAVLPDMLVATVIRPPSFSGKARDVDPARALEAPGVHRVFPIASGVAVVADSYWQARSASSLVEVEWDAGELGELASDEIQRRFEARGADHDGAVRDDGDALEAIEAVPAERRVRAVYDVPYLAHATLEPQNCTVRIADGRCEVWAPTQGPGVARELVAAVHGFSRDDVIVHQTLVGGGFGRRIAQDYVVEAVEIALELGRPVKVLWSREDDTRHDWYRPKGHHVLEAALDDEGRATAWRHRIVTSSLLGSIGTQMVPAVLPDWVPRFLKSMTASGVSSAMASGLADDPANHEGASELPYAFGDVRVECALEDVGVPLGFWRSVGHSGNAFPVECFVDELAERGGVDPFEFRRGLLADAPRHRGVLELAARRAGWGESPPDGVGRGIAQHASFGSYVALVVDASVDGGAIRVRRVVCALDCGFVVNPDIVRAQMEGGIVFGLAAALHQEITLEGGAVRQGNFDGYPLLRMKEVPEIEVHLVDSDAPPSGVGEPGVPPVAPALANALHAATGRRARSLPLAPHFGG